MRYCSTQHDHSIGAAVVLFHMSASLHETIHSNFFKAVFLDLHSRDMGDCHVFVRKVVSISVDLVKSYNTDITRSTYYAFLVCALKERGA